MVWDIIGKLGGRSFIVALVGLVAVVITSTTGFNIPDNIKSTLIEAVAAIVAAHSIGRGVADGMSKGITASTPGTPEADAPK